MASRYKFLDLLRGLAILFMVINHTARWWLDQSLSYLGYQIIYTTVTLAAPLFLFLVGFCLVISYQKALQSKSNIRIISKYLIRGFCIIIIGYIFNFVVFGFEHLWTGKVLQAIGFGIILSLPFLYLMRSNGAIKYIAGLAIVLPISFWLLFQAFPTWLSGHFWIKELFFSDFPLWPYFSLILMGLILGKYFVDYDKDTDKLKIFFVKVFNWGFIFIACAFVMAFMRLFIYHLPLLYFGNDYALNGYWIPGFITSIWIIGVILGFLGASYFMADNLGRASLWLERLGQGALFVYIFHYLIVLNLFSSFLNLRISNPLLYLVDILALIVFLAYSTKLWLLLKKITKKNLNLNLCFQKLR